jgi:hypothetical protein
LGVSVPGTWCRSFRPIPIRSASASTAAIVASRRRAMV